MSIRQRLIIGAVLVATTGCREKEKDIRVEPAAAIKPAEPELLLRSYDVPGGNAPQVQAILARVFRGVKEKVPARAELTPDGRLVVVAPAGMHQGVESLIAKMGSGKPVVRAARIDTTCWLVIGRPAEKTTFGADVGAVKAALEAVAGAQGPMEFGLLERLRVQTVADRQGRTDGRYSRFSQVASVTGGTITADLELAVERDKGVARLETRVSLEPGKLLVLGEAGFDPPADFWPITRAGARTGKSTLFYVIRTDVRSDG